MILIRQQQSTLFANTPHVSENSRFTVKDLVQRPLGNAQNFVAPNQYRLNYVDRFSPEMVEKHIEAGSVNLTGVRKIPQT
ncbi:hypothetical protein [Scytonema sp. NUACC21]